MIERSRTDKRQNGPTRMRNREEPAFLGKNPVPTYIHEDNPFFVELLLIEYGATIEIKTNRPVQNPRSVCFNIYAVHYGKAAANGPFFI
jgi:hypothetical protein